MRIRKDKNTSVSHIVCSISYYITEYITEVDNKYYYSNIEGFPYSRYTLPLYNFIPNN